MSDEIQPSQAPPNEDFNLTERLKLSIKGSIWRTLLRLIGIFFSMILLGLYGFLCVGNYMGNKLPVGLPLVKSLLSALFFGIRRGALLLWSILLNLDSMELAKNWGDLIMVILTLGIVFFFWYTWVAIFCDTFDGKVSDKAPMWLKIIITLGITILFSMILFIATDKPEGDYIVNDNVFLDDYGRAVCIETGEIPLFIPRDASVMPVYEQVNVTEEISDGMQVI